ncbi:MAG: hypothetical protein HQ521_10175 [Bacteroidetes bacterium]|nr:hypothetical protein [Bacteroidota bacterium]
MKKQKFISLSEVSLPLDNMKLEQDELVAIKGGYGDAKAGDNCHCECAQGAIAGSGDNCNCTCPD